MDSVTVVDQVGIF